VAGIEETEELALALAASTTLGVFWNGGGISFTDGFAASIAEGVAAAEDGGAEAPAGSSTSGGAAVSFRAWYEAALSLAGCADPPDL
jgi:hypothetical protein